MSSARKTAVQSNKMKNRICILLIISVFLCMFTVSCNEAVNTPDETVVIKPSNTETKPQTESLPVIVTVPETQPEPVITTEIPPEINTQDAKCIFVYEDGVGLLSVLGDMNAQIYPASITKLVTALVALEYAPLDYEITAGAELAYILPDSSVAYLTQGARLTVDMLIKAMLLPSGCDASYVLAAGVGKLIAPDAATVDEAILAFENEMNNWCAHNGMTGSHFENPDGYHADGHYITMADALTLGRLCIANQTVSDTARLPSAAVTNLNGYTYNWENTNLLLHSETEYYNPYCVGYKTGITDPAGKCLLSAFVKDGRTLIVGVFGCASNNSRFKIAGDIEKFYLGE